MKLVLKDREQFVGWLSWSVQKNMWKTAIHSELKISSWTLQDDPYLQHLRELIFRSKLTSAKYQLQLNFSVIVRLFTGYKLRGEVFF